MFAQTNPKNKPLQKIVERSGKTCMQASRALGMSQRGFYNCIDSPFKLTLTQLHTLSSFVGIPFLELIYLINCNKSKLTAEDNSYLSGLEARALTHLPVDENKPLPKQ